jgi:micrococcal nuclease
MKEEEKPIVKRTIHPLIKPESKGVIKSVVKHDVIKESKNKDKVIAIFAGLFLLMLFIFFFLFLFYNSSNPNSIFFENNTVTNVIDGDTFEYTQITDSSRKIITVRLLCVDTPEENQPGYEEAKEYLASLILHKKVVLVSSEQGADKDAYGRDLKYVYIGGLFVNKEILNNNLGELLIIPPETCDKVK